MDLITEEPNAENFQCGWAEVAEHNYLVQAPSNAWGFVKFLDSNGCAQLFVALIRYRLLRGCADHTNKIRFQFVICVDNLDGLTDGKQHQFLEANKPRIRIRFGHIYAHMQHRSIVGRQIYIKPEQNLNYVFANTASPFVGSHSDRIASHCRQSVSGV